MKKLFFLLFVLSANLMYAQRTVTGIVSDTDNKPLEKVNVSVKNSPIMVQTSTDGTYVVVVPDEYSVLEFSKSGFKVHTVTITGNELNVVMDMLTDDELYNLSLEEMMNIEVTSASNAKEKLSDVPATMIVLTKDDLMERGYNNLSEIIDDLPGMDLSRIYGYGAILNYWRGYRSTLSQPYLFMIDGMEHNDLKYNGTEVMTIVPISNIEKVEVVYGPVSSVYGANAFMGVINVITKKGMEADGTSVTANTSTGLKGYYIGDYNVNVQKGKFRANAGIRIENGDQLDFIHLDDYYYTSEKFLTDTLLWGQAAKMLYPDGKAESPNRFVSVNLRAAYGETEMGFMINSFESNWGHNYVSDKVQLNTPLSRVFYSGWLKHNFIFSDKFSSNLILRYKLENSPLGDWMEGYNVTNTSGIAQDIGGKIILPGETTRIIDYSYWPLRDYNWSLNQDFDAVLSDKLMLKFGLKFEQKFITKQKGLYGAAFTPDNLDINNENFYPTGTHSLLHPNNTFVWNDYGVFAQARYAITENNLLNMGVRIDNNSEYGTSTTFRGGYVGHFGKFGMKLLYGQAYQIPTPRTLYSSWSVLGASVNLKPEKSQTAELQLNYATGNLTSLISAYYVNNTNTIISVTGGAKNLGERNVAGIDVHLNTVIPVTFLKKLQIWAFYSTYLLDQEQKFDNNGNKTTKELIGDLAHNKVYFGVTSYFTDNLMLNLRGRYFSERKTIETNPIDKIPGYFLMDGNLVYKNLGVEGFDVGIKVQNIFDTKYFHTGKANADGGEEPAQWVNGVWQGSAGWDASKIPQPHRFIMISLMLNL